MTYHRLLVSPRTLPAILTCVLWSQAAFTQTADSSSTGGVPSLQFQLIGGYGADYIADRTAEYSFRLGVDVAFSHGDSAGTTGASSTSTYLSSGGSSGSSSQYNYKPDQISTSLQVSVSALSVCRIAESLRSTLGVGIGGIVSYSYNQSSDEVKQNTPGLYYSSGSSDRTINSWSIGPMVLLGIRSLLTAHFCLTAEMSFSVVHQWTTAKILTNYDYSSYGPTPTYQTNNTSESTRLEGWVFELSKIRIGVAFDL